MNQPVIRVLIVDDEAAIRRALRPPLVELGFQIHEASRGEEALQLLHSTQVDVVLLDINMPGIGGIETLRRIRAAAPRLPVLMVTVLDGEEEKVEALELGADDYITKPFSTGELLARVRAALRRAPTSTPEQKTKIEAGDFRIDLDSRSVRVGEREVRLTPKEFDVLVYMAQHPHKVLTHRAILNAVWGSNSMEQNEYLRVFVGQLRKKLEPNVSAPKYILTEPWIGYRFEPGD